MCSDLYFSQDFAILCVFDLHSSLMTIAFGYQYTNFIDKETEAQRGPPVVPSAASSSSCLFLIASSYPQCLGQALNSSCISQQCPNCFSCLWFPSAIKLLKHFLKYKFVYINPHLKSFPLPHQLWDNTSFLSMAHTALHNVVPTSILGNCSWPSVWECGWALGSKMSRLQAV